MSLIYDAIQFEPQFNLPAFFRKKIMAVAQQSCSFTGSSLIRKHVLTAVEDKRFFCRKKAKVKLNRY